MYHFIPPLKWLPVRLKADVETDEGKHQNETWTLNKEMNGSSLAVRVSLIHGPIVQSVRASEPNLVVVWSDPI